MIEILNTIIIACLACAIVFFWWKNTQHINQTKQLEQVRSEQESSLAELRQQVNELQFAAAQAQSQEQFAKHATQTAQEQSSKLEAQVQKLETQLAQLQQNNQELQSYKETAQLEFQKQEHKLSNKVEILEADKTRLEAQVKELNETQAQGVEKIRAEHEEQLKLLKTTAQETETRAQKNFDELFKNFKTSAEQQQQETKTTYEKQLADLKEQLNKKKEETAQEQNALKTEYETRIGKLTDDYEKRIKEIQEQAQEIREKQAQSDKESFNAALKTATDNFEEQKAQLKAHYEEHLASLKQKQEETKAEYEKQIANLQQLQKEELQRMHELHAQEFKQFKENIEKRNLELTNSQSQTFVEKTSQQLELITNPLKEHIESVMKSLQGVAEQQNNTGIEFKTNMEQVGRYVATMSENSKDLINALRKNNKKFLGNWGEMQLETLLEDLGLVKGKTFFTQYIVSGITDRKHIPDFVIRLPEKRHVIVDAKTTLESYLEVTEATTAEEEKNAAKNLSRAIRNHIDNLAEKNYADKSQFLACDLVLMYIPIENILYYLNQYDPAIFNYALDKKITIVSNNSLAPVLTMIGQVWKNYELQHNVQKVVESANNFFVNFAPLADKILRLGKSLHKANTDYKEVVTKFTGNRHALAALKDYNAKASEALKELEKVEVLDLDATNQIQKVERAINKHIAPVDIDNLKLYTETEQAENQEENAEIQAVVNFFRAEAAKYQDVDHEVGIEQAVAEDNLTVDEGQVGAEPHSEVSTATPHNLNLAVPPSVLRGMSSRRPLVGEEATGYAVAQQASEEIGVVDSDWQEDSVESDVEDISVDELQQLQKVVADTSDAIHNEDSEQDVVLEDVSDKVTDWLRGNYFYYEAPSTEIEDHAELDEQLSQLYRQLLEVLNTTYRNEKTQEFATFAQVFYAYQAQLQDGIELDSFAGWHPYDVLNLVLGANIKNLESYLVNHELGEQILDDVLLALPVLQDEFYTLQKPLYIIKDQGVTKELFKEYDAMFADFDE